MNETLNIINKEHQDKETSQLFRYRLTWIRLFFWLFPITVVVLVLMNIFGPDTKDLRDVNDFLSVEWQEEKPHRGTIYSDSHDALAVDLTMYSISFDPRAPGLKHKNYEKGKLFENNYKLFAQGLDSVFASNGKFSFVDYLYGLYTNPPTGNGSRNIPIGDHRISPSDLNYLKTKSKMLTYDANKCGFKITPHHIRMYPYGELARRTIGMNDQEGHLSGLEKSMDYQLGGRKGAYKSKRVTGLQWMAQSDVNNIESQDGWDVITTINIPIQKFLQNEMRRHIRAVDANWGSAIVMDVKTGDIKAIVGVQFDHAKDTVYVEKPNDDFIAIQRKTEPGSTFKTVVFTAVMDLKHPSMNEMFNIKGKSQTFVRRNQLITITDDHPVGDATLKQVLEQSSNIGMSMLVDRYFQGNESTLYDRILDFGFLKSFDLDALTSLTPYIRKKGDANWTYGDFMRMSFGYTTDMAPIHIAMFYNAIANNGVLVRPRFVTRFENSRSHQTIENKPVIVLNPKICSDETLKNVKECLRGVVTEGTARKIFKNCQIPCAGKTGTAKLKLPFSHGYTTNAKGMNRYYGSFVGYFPADNPKYTVYVGFDTYAIPHTGRTYAGADLSGPIFRKVAEFIDTNIKDESSDAKYEPTCRSKLNSSFGSSEQLVELYKDLKLNISENILTAKYCAVDTAGKISLQNNPTDSSGNLNLKGYCMSDALKILYSAGYKVKVVGEGNVDRAVFSDKSVTLFLKVK